MAVSTALTSIAPFVPGSFTYSSLGGGDGLEPGVHLVPSPSSMGLDGGAGERSLLRPCRALLNIRGINRDVREEWRGVLGRGSGMVVDVVAGKVALEAFGGNGVVTERAVGV